MYIKICTHKFNLVKFSKFHLYRISMQYRNIYAKINDIEKLFYIIYFTFILSVLCK